jgi:hypothetical protein
MNRATLIKNGLILGTAFFSLIAFVTVGFTKDFNELNSMSDSQLNQMIDSFEKTLDQNKSDDEEKKGLGIAYHIKAQKNPKKFAPKALKHLTAAYELNKSDTIVMCYLGSATTMMAKTTWNPMKKMEYANKGIGLMDKAVRKTPDNVSVRMVRAYNSMKLPGFLKRKDVAVKDFEYLADRIKKEPGKYASLEDQVSNALKELNEEKQKTNEPDKQDNPLAVK